jgi:hypothetical protein
MLLHKHAVYACTGAVRASLCVVGGLSLVCGSVMQWPSCELQLKPSLGVLAVPAWQMCIRSRGLLVRQHSREAAGDAHYECHESTLLTFVACQR